MSKPDVIVLSQLWLKPPGSWTEAIDLIAPLSKLLPVGEKRLEELAQVAAERKDGFAAYEIGVNLMNDLDPDDLGKAWQWVAACLGCKQARLAMAEMILDRADELGPLFGPRLVPLMADWLRLAATDFRSDPFGSLVDPPDRKPAPKGLARLAPKGTGPEVPPGDVAPAPPTHRPVVAIGTDKSNEGRNIAERWKALATDLPLLGGHVDPDQLEARLIEEMPWAEDAARAIADDVRLVRLSGRPHFWVRPILLVGPPGIGKTHFLTALARLVGVPWSLINLGGSNDNRMLAGTARGWSTAQPAFPLVAMLATTPCANPMVIADELDKASSNRHNGSAWDALLAFLEPTSSKNLFDECLLCRVDVSPVSWCCTANDEALLPAPLLSRLSIVRLKAPKAGHFDVLLEGFRRDLAATLRLTDVRMLPDLLADDFTWLRRVFTRSGNSVRTTKRAFERLVALRGREEAIARARPN